VLYLDAAVDRITDDHRRRFTDAVEAARLGTIFASGQKQTNRAYKAWRRNLEGDRPDAGAGLTGDALERAVGVLAAFHPEYVEHV